MKPVVNELTIVACLLLQKYCSLPYYPHPLHVVEKVQSQQNLPSSQPIKKPEINHQPIIKSHTNSNHLHSQPITKYDATDSTNTPLVPRTTNGVMSGYIPNPPVRNPLRITIPSSKPARPRSSQSAHEQLGVKSPPPMRTNGGINALSFSFLLAV